MTTDTDILKPVDLFDFQQQDVDSLRGASNVLIAHEMGLGKTYMAIELDRRHRMHANDIREDTLVVCPLSIVSVWEEHYKELMPELRLRVIDSKNRDKFLRKEKSEADVYITHWESLRLMPELLAVNWLHIIADEVHRAKNRKAQQTRALKRLKTRYKTALSGTPVTNKPYDLWSILNWLYRQDFRSYWKFYEAYCDYKIQYPHGYHKFLGPKNEKLLLQSIRPFYRRRLKVDVLPDLPNKYYSRVYVTLTPQQRRAYDQMAKEMIAWLETQDGLRPLPAPAVIAQLVRLQQFAIAYVQFDEQPSKTGGRLSVTLTEPSSKLDVLMDILEDNPDEQIVVFSQFKQAINLACRRLDKADIPYALITGDIKHTDRGPEVDRFQSGEARVFLGTIAAGGEGITLTASSTVVFLDRDWSPAKNAQAEDRLHRIGQDEAVHVIDLIAKNTVDAGRHQRLELKREWIRRVLGDE